ncbi:gliding motility-associated C-terminal domain-containing protein [Kaistella sp. G5-32]|uniref:Gliding motility-associated C-terminal domain-containing protein n=1 Tax=Kaistella gelatinilytica TaxID=2787636 RepID=A0ABS0FET5_9FLAO|nr:T9SS type B sorting domain-containing protein [Kaistella gelatinilytica]MBF8458218.1 gliding motility-associated C-terminal domain-containing protein [Kaistella gelatinilytica]
MKKLLFFFFVFISLNSYAQLDREHWFAPMMDEVGNGNQYQSIYMSTNEAVPFNVDIYSNNIVVASVTISKNNPGKYSIANAQRGRIITTDKSDLFRPIAMGFYLKGAKPFFASLRFSIKNHGEIQTSKGTAALGTEFRAVMAPITVNNGILNFMNSILATEDNTSVTITNFNPNITFSDFVPRSQFNFVLNKGQSYIIEGTGDYSANYTGYIGAKIVSDKPVIIANGNFNGQYAGNFGSSSDILMDQGVPIDKLGQEFVLMKGNGDPSSNMEKGLILATENGTEIYVNGSGSPVATLNAGQYYQTDNTAYINQGYNNYNMFIRATKNVYVYQLLAGANNSSTEATGGFNYIPPLNCYLPKKIDEIGRIEENEYSSNGVNYSLTVPTKLNIITEKGALVDVKRNGISLALTVSNGPFPVLGNTNWVTYSIPNITGNIAIFSSNAVTAGISAGNDAVGYGGYFAGFSSIPLILKTDGECLPGVKLEVTAGFDSYQWLIKVGATYVPAPGVNNTFEYSPTQAGIYAVKVKQGSCPEIQTKDYKFYNCTTYTNYDYTTCTSQIVPVNFALSSQAVNIPTIKIDTPPTKGTVVINANGTITYTANPNSSGADTFKFSFCGSGAIPDCETVQATVNLNQIVKYDKPLNSCSATNTATYDLTSAAITPDATVVKKYFSDAAYTNQIPAGQLTNYTSAPGFVYVQLSNSYGCTATATIELKITAPPIVNPALYTVTHCDEEIDGIIDGNYKVDLATITPLIVQNPTNFTTKYFATEAKAITGLPADILTGNFVFTANTSVWIRVDSPATCPPVIKEVFLKIGAKAPLIDFVVTKDVCDLLENNSEAINLDSYIPFFNTTTGTTATYFSSLTSAQNNTPTIPAAQTITGNKTFYYRLNVPGFCNEIGTLNVILSKGTATALLDSYPVCDGSSITLTAEDSPVYTAWSWKKGTVTVSTTRTATLDAGVYTVEFTNGSGCIFKKTITVTSSPKPLVDATAFTTTYCDSNFDGISDPVNFNTITPIIVTNFVTNPGVFTVKYYLNAGDRDANNANTIPNLTNFTFTVNTTIYFRVDSPVCPSVTGQFDLKFNNIIILNPAPVSTTICDDNIDGTETISLANYSNLFTTETGVSARYFATLADAQNNTPTINVSQPITGNKTFYYRFKKGGLCDAIGTLNIIFKASTPTALKDSYLVCDGSSIPLTAEGSPTYNAWLWKKGTVIVSTTNTATLDAGVYTIEFTNASGCKFTKTITVTNSPKPIVDAAAFTTTYCDSNFDGISDPINFNSITPIIVTNFAANPGVFTVKYYLNAGDRDANNGNTIPNLTNFTFTANTTIYFRVDSPVCSSVLGKFDLKFNNSIVLNPSTFSTTICDDNLDGTETISLANYRNLFTTETGVSVQYFATLADAQNNTPTINASQPITGNQTFYYRFKKGGLCDAIGTLNIIFKASTPTALLDSYTVCEGSSKTLTAESTYTTYLWKKGTVVVSTTNTAILTAGVYTIEFTNSSGCKFTKNITIVEAPKPIWKVTNYNATNCDDNFDGIIKIDLTAVTPVILPNFTFFTVEYFTDSTLQNLITDPANWTYTANTIIYVRATSAYCPAETESIDFKFGNDLPLLEHDVTEKVCDDDFDGIKSVNLSTFITDFTADSGVSVSYYTSLVDAQNKVNPVSNPVTITNSGIYYLRFHKNLFCDAIGKLTINIQKAKKSDVLKDQNICPDATVVLDAGPGFDGYIWSTGETTQQITVPVGDYSVDLRSGTCTYPQNVSVKAVALPTITSIEIKGSTVTVTVTGGNPPYKYAIDNGNYQTSNIFTNVSGGEHTVYVISADNCTPVSADIDVIELYNVITPNGDGINDILNYSALLKKEEPFLQIYDRYGKLVFTGDKNNRFSWDGKAFGKLVNTESYWYVMKWKEPGFTTVTEYKGWILVKNRQ